MPPGPAGPILPRGSTYYSFVPRSPDRDPHTKIKIQTDGVEIVYHIGDSGRSGRTSTRDARHPPSASKTSKIKHYDDPSSGRSRSHSARPAADRSSSRHGDSSRRGSFSIQDPQPPHRSRRESFTDDRRESRTRADSKVQSSSSRRTWESQEPYDDRPPRESRRTGRESVKESTRKSHDPPYQSYSRRPFVEVPLQDPSTPHRKTYSYAYTAGPPSVHDAAFAPPNTYVSATHDSFATHSYAQPYDSPQPVYHDSYAQAHTYDPPPPKSFATHRGARTSSSRKPPPNVLRPTSIEEPDDGPEETIGAPDPPPWKGQAWTPFAGGEGSDYPRAPRRVT